MALGAMEAVKARNMSGIAIIGFDALPEALAQVRDGGLTATIEQFPGKQSAIGVQTIAEFIKSGKKPDQPLILLTPVAITKENISDGERSRRSQVSVKPNASPDRCREKLFLLSTECSITMPDKNLSAAKHLLSMQGISKRFPGVKALEDVRLEVRLWRNSCAFRREWCRQINIIKNSLWCTIGR